MNESPLPTIEVERYGTVAVASLRWKDGMRFFVSPSTWWSRRLALRYARRHVGGPIFVGKVIRH